MELKGHKSQVATVAFSPDNKRAVTASKVGVNPSARQELAWGGREAGCWAWHVQVYI